MMKLYMASSLTANNMTFLQAWSSFAKYFWQLTEVNRKDCNQISVLAMKLLVDRQATFTSTLLNNVISKGELL